MVRWGSPVQIRLEAQGRPQAYSSIGRASVSKTEGCRFDSYWACCRRDVAIRKDMKRVVQFFKDSVAELKKVVWPSREEVITNTRIVLISISLFAIALGLVDFLLANLVELIF